MRNVSVEDLQRAIAQLGEGDRRDLEIEIAVGRFARDKLSVTRLVDWIPEAFGYVLLPNVADLVLPTAFRARTRDGSWKEFSFDREPIFGQTVTLATELYRENPRGLFSAVAKRSVMVHAVDGALNEGRSLNGTQIAGPSMARIPAEYYDVQPKAPTSFWRKLVG